MLLSGCYAISIQSADNTPVLFNQQGILARQPYKVIRHFYRDIQMDYVFGAQGSEAVMVSQLLAAEVATGQGIINLKVRQQPDALDMVISALTLGIYVRSHLILEGDVIQLEVQQP